VSVPNNSSTTFYADAVDAAGNVSGCSPSGVTYIEDSGLPTAPVLTTTVPASPANNNTPRVMGTAEAGTTVRLYLDPGCTMFAAQGDDVTFASPGIPVNVADNTTTTFYATATKLTGSVSACSTTSVTYREDSIAPTVTAVTPPDGSLQVSVTTTITAMFSEPMDPATISGTTFGLTGNGGAIAGNVTYSGMTATFTPSGALPFGITFTATISTGAKDLAGNPLATSMAWTFTTPPPPDTTPPTVVSTSPLMGANQVDWSTTITATFSEPVDPTTVNAQSFLLTEVGVPVQGTVTYSRNTATFTPSQVLSLYGPYQATVTTAVRDLAGNAMAAPFTWSFSTRDGQWGTVGTFPGTPVTPTFAFVAVGQGGDAVQVHVEGSTGFSVYTQLFDPDGGSWTNKSLLDLQTSPVQPSACVNAAGEAMAIWRHLSNGGPPCLTAAGTNCTVSSRHDIQSQAWGQISLVDNPPKTMLGTLPLQVGWDSNGNVIALERLNNAGTQETWAIRYDAAQATWNQPVMLSSAGGSQLLTALDGSAIIFWGLCTARYDPALGTWSSPRCRDPSPDAGVQAQSSAIVAMNAAGSAIAAWAQSDPVHVSTMWVDRFNSATGQWTGPTSLPNNTPPPATAITPIGISLDRSGNAVVLWSAWYSDGGGSSAFFSNRYDQEGQVWQDPVQVAVNAAAPSAVAFDSAGRGFALGYVSASSTYSIRYLPGAGWQPQNVTTMPGFTQLAFDGKGRAFAFGFGMKYARFE
jgi:hypothetical protein